VFLFGEYIFEFYTNNPSTDEYAVKLSYLYMLLLPFDFVRYIFAGTLRAVGLQNMATKVVIFSNYAIAIPAAYIFTFVLGLNAVGTVLGEMPATLCRVILFGILIKRLDWEQMLEQIISTVVKDKNKIVRLDVTKETIESGRDSSPVAERSSDR
jgi:Na+-driven multidrug efflux pump